MVRESRGIYWEMNSVLHLHIVMSNEPDNITPGPTNTVMSCLVASLIKSRTFEAELSFWLPGRNCTSLFGRRLAAFCGRYGLLRV